MPNVPVSIAIESLLLISPRTTLTLAQIRIRHPRGVTTLELDPEMTTLDALRVLIFSSTEIPPNEQESEL